MKKVKESVEKTTLGDLTALSNLKTEMEAAEKKKVDGDAVKATDEKKED